VISGRKRIENSSSENDFNLFLLQRLEKEFFKDLSFDAEENCEIVLIQLNVQSIE
jgi:hypothetical protein